MSAWPHNRAGLSRRLVLAAAAAAALPRRLRAAEDSPQLRPQFGLQLYSVAKDLDRDLAGTLARVAALGYTDVEFASFGKHTAAELQGALKAAGLTCRSAHYTVPQLQYDPDRSLAFARELGLRYMICAYPRAQNVRCPTPAEWKWNADFFNIIGAQVKKAGLAFGYHNHNIEFLKIGGRTGLQGLMERTDPALVTFELDCGWAAAAGIDPAALMAQYPGRFTLLHVKDVRRGSRPNTVMQIDTAITGQGVLDWPKLLPAAAAAGIKDYYVEIEPNVTAAPFDAARDIRDYLVKL